jgi:hypothetical protein
MRATRIPWRNRPNLAVVTCIIRFILPHLHVRDHAFCSDQGSVPRPRQPEPRRNVRDRVTDLRTASLRQPLPTSATIQHNPGAFYRQLISASATSSESQNTNIFKISLANLRETARPIQAHFSFATQQQPTWRSSSPAAHTPSPPSSKATRTSQRSARTAATSAHESTSAGSGSRSVLFLVRPPCAWRNTKKHSAGN